MTAIDPFDAINDALHRGDLIAAFDLAEAQSADDPRCAYLALLALARAGATGLALERYHATGLAERAAAAGPPLDAQIPALKARLHKDLALAQAPGSAGRRQALLEAAWLFQDVFDQSGRSHPAINAATLFQLAGDSGRARTCAAAALAAGLASPGGDHGDYWAQATAAEAHLLLGDRAAAEHALDAAAKVCGDGWDAVAATRKQLRLVCQATGQDGALLARLPAPTLCTYVGHLPGPRFPAAAEDRVRDAIAHLFATHRPRIAFGSLAAGADILFAEAALAAGCRLEVVLPCDVPTFEKISVARHGGAWSARFHKCLAGAVSVTPAVTDAFLDDDVLFGYGTRLSLGSALLRRGFLDAEAIQFAVWDGAAPSGTAAAVALWRAAGRPAWRIDPVSAACAPSPAAPPAPLLPAAGTAPRSLKALVFGDLKDFSKLREKELPAFATTILGTLASALEPWREGRGLDVANTWGDGIHLVFGRAADAARCTLAMQAGLARVDRAAAGLSASLGLRLGVHFGPVFTLRDPILGQDGFMGPHISRAARIEPVAAEGSITVSHEFAAELTLECPDAFSLDYLGVVATDKNYGRMPLYLLRDRDAGA